MVDINPDILEVPDTPDRMLRSIVASSVQSPSSCEIIEVGSIRMPLSRRSFPTRHTHDVDRPKFPGAVDNAQLFKEADAARQLSDAQDGSAVLIHGAKKRGFNSGKDTQDAPLHPGRPRRLVTGNDAASSQCSHGVSVAVIPESCLKNNHPLVKGKDVVHCDDDATAKEPSEKRERFNQDSHQAASLPKPAISLSAGHRRLVRNGCISPHNIVKRSEASNQPAAGGTSNLVSHCTNLVDLSDIDSIVSSPPRANHRIKANNGFVYASQTGVLGRSANASSSATRGHENRKGKAIVIDALDTDDLMPIPNRELPGFRRNLSIADSDSQGWRTTHNHVNGRSDLLVDSENSREIDLSSDHANSNFLTKDHSDSVALKEPLFQNHSRLESQQNDLMPRLPRGRRSSHSNSSHRGESSSSSALPEIRDIRSFSRPRRSLPRNHVRRHDPLFDPILELDVVRDNVPSMGRNEHASGLKDSREQQVESDELLARTLQEEFYNESPWSPSPSHFQELNVSVEFLQQEDAAAWAPVSRGSLRSSHSSSLWRNPRATRTQRRRSSRMGRLGRRSEDLMMDLGMDIDFIEALDDRAVINPASNFLLRTNGDFDENDYDLLLSLDEHVNPRRGASDSLINGLPQSVLQSDCIDEPCAVCLENPSAGETIRYLPCLHKFHKDCIDEWLRRKTVCPVCKCEIQ